MVDQYHDAVAIARVFELAWAHSQVELRHLQLSPEDMHVYQRLAAHVLYAGSALRPDPAVVAANRQGQPGLWRHAISGDKPIVLARVAESEDMALVQHLLAAHGYWRLKGLEVDLVILNEHPTSYLEEIHQQIQTLVRASPAHDLADKPGGVFVRKADQISDDDRILLQAAARVVLAGNRGSLARQVERQEPPRPLPAPLIRRAIPSEQRVALVPRDEGQGRAGILSPAFPSIPGLLELAFPNGIGGFTPDGREYVIEVKATPHAPLLPPNPWINVIANPLCGFLISENGAGFTWVGNSQTNRLTPWNNDPVSDQAG